MKTKTLRIDEKNIEATYIGKGLFSKVYRAGDTVYILCQGDYSKECIALFVDQSLPHIPNIIRHEDIDNYQVFSMPYYHKLTKKAYPKAYHIWKYLPYTVKGPDEINKLIINLRGKYQNQLANAIEELWSAFCNYCYEDMLMEFQKHNVSVDNNGELILRDCLTSISSIRNRRKKGKQL